MDNDLDKEIQIKYTFINGSKTDDENIDSKDLTKLQYFIRQFNYGAEEGKDRVKSEVNNAKDAINVIEREKDEENIDPEVLKNLQYSMAGLNKTVKQKNFNHFESVKNEVAGLLNDPVYLPFVREVSDPVLRLSILSEKAGDSLQHAQSALDLIEEDPDFISTQGRWLSLYAVQRGEEDPETISEIYEADGYYSGDTIKGLHDCIINIAADSYKSLFDLESADGNTGQRREKVEKSARRITKKIVDSMGESFLFGNDVKELDGYTYLIEKYPVEFVSRYANEKFYKEVQKSFIDPSSSYQNLATIALCKDKDFALEALELIKEYAPISVMEKVLRESNDGEIVQLAEKSLPYMKDRSGNRFVTDKYGFGDEYKERMKGDEPIINNKSHL